MTDNANKSRERSSMLNMRIDPKLKFLVEAAAKYQDRTLSNFIERAIRKALTVEAVEGSEPCPGLYLSKERMKELQKENEPLWGESLWDDDEATRFFNLATNSSNLMSPAERNYFNFFCEHMRVLNKRITLRNFIDFWNDALKPQSAEEDN